nr:RHS repeat-associated core domain-containing protein [Streptomyces shenzhenensis]
MDSRPSVWPNGHTYLGAGIDDTATALTHLGAREYDPSTGRFISADPVIDMGDPLQVNGYAYSHDNPVTHSDPTGLYDPDRMAYEREQKRLMNDNPGLHKPRAKPPVVVNSDLHNILAAIYIRDQGTTATGNGKVATEDFLLGDLGPTAYAHAGPAFRTLMTECMTAEGIEVPESWRA